MRRRICLSLVLLLVGVPLFADGAATSVAALFVRAVEQFTNGKETNGAIDAPRPSYGVATTRRDAMALGASLHHRRRLRSAHFRPRSSPPP